MIVTPKTKGFICTTAHPAGCAENVRRAARYAADRPIAGGPKRVLIIGSSTGYGLACRVTAAFGCGADTVGVAFERPASGKRTATAGWYNTDAFHRLAAENGGRHHSLNGDAFSDEMKAQTAEAVREHLGQADLVIYSLAAPRRTDPADGTVWSSAIKPIGSPFRSKTLDFHSAEVSEVEVAPASPEEICGTVKVMGGEDWLHWMHLLQEQNLLAPGALTLAFSYIGPSLTHPVYKDGTIGQAKLDLEAKAREIDALLLPLGGKAYISVNKALVTQASSAIPVVPLYIALLMRVMKEQGTHEDCTMQMARMFERLYQNGGDPARIPVDEAGRIRMDDLEMAEGVQREVEALWQRVDSENVQTLGDLSGYRDDFFALFGFGVDSVDYGADVPV